MNLNEQTVNTIEQFTITLSHYAAIDPDNKTPRYVVEPLATDEHGASWNGKSWGAAQEIRIVVTEPIASINFLSSFPDFKWNENDPYRGGTAIVDYVRWQNDYQHVGGYCAFATFTDYWSVALELANVPLSTPEPPAVTTESPADDPEPLTLMQAINAMHEALEQRARDCGTQFYCLKDGSPEWMSKAAMTAHLDEFPNDEVYDAIHDALIAFRDAPHDVDEDTLREQIETIEPEIYTANLLKWVSANLSRQSYVDDAMKEYQPETLHQALAMGMSQWVNEVANALVSAIVDFVDGQ